MKPRANLALIGSGPSTIYLLKHLLEESEFLSPHLEAISIFEKSSFTGMGMPYSPQTTDKYNISNISSEELPELPATLFDWLQSCTDEELREMEMNRHEISETEIYPRLVLGRYLHSQYRELIRRFDHISINIHEHPDCEIIDVRDDPQRDQVSLTTARAATHVFDKIIVATGHCWAEEDRADEGFFASPWPISKLLPKPGKHHNFPIGTLGASLSAFDVITSLAHRHGDFSKADHGLHFEPHPGTENFKITMHAAHGRLPHLQFDQEEPLRDIYRHVDREGLLALLDDRGFLRLETYFDKVCRPALSKAFQKDGLLEMVALLDQPEFSLKDFVAKMSDEHDYENAFEGMRFEMIEARKSVLGHQPIHWKETIDDLIYTLNFHAELMPAEDHITLQAKVMPFLMNVVAAMPLESGEILLALYDAGKLEIVSGKVSIDEEAAGKHCTTVKVVADDESEAEFSYRLFIDCSGQKPLELDDYPFPSLVQNGSIRKARAVFADPQETDRSVPAEKQDRIFEENGRLFYPIGGIDIDGTYRLIGTDAQPNPRVSDVAFPHTSGVRPYSYGLQACSDSAAIVVEGWKRQLNTKREVSADPTEIYEKI